MTRPGSKSALMQQESDALLHELHVHQIELEQQNEELRRTQIDLAAARDRFVDLYDFAPVGYFTLDGDGVVVEANLTSATQLGVQRGTLVGRRFARFVAPQDSDRWYRQQALPLVHGEPHRIELSLLRDDRERFDGQLDCLRVETPGGAPVLRVTLADITQRKLAEHDRRIANTVVSAREDERRRLSRELHEDLGQRLSALKMNLASLHPSANLAGGDARVTSMYETIDMAVATIRRMATDLRPLMLDDLGLNAALDWLARDRETRLGVSIALYLDDNDLPLGEPTAVAIYRLAETALARLAGRGATVISISLRQRPGESRLTVQGQPGTPIVDATIGAAGPVSANRGSDLTVDLRDQVHLLGGRIELDDGPAGTQRVVVTLPMALASIEPKAT